MALSTEKRRVKRDRDRISVVAGEHSMHWVVVGTILGATLSAFLKEKRITQLFKSKTLVGFIGQRWAHLKRKPIEFYVGRPHWPKSCRAITQDARAAGYLILNISRDLDDLEAR